jgi:hypothetical protein
MKQSKKIAILGIGVEVFLGAIMIALLATFGSSAETAQRIGTALGGAMGAFGVFCLVWWYVERRKEK